MHYQYITVIKNSTGNKAYETNEKELYFLCESVSQDVSRLSFRAEIAPF